MSKHVGSPAHHQLNFDKLEGRSLLSTASLSAGSGNAPLNPRADVMTRWEASFPLQTSQASVFTAGSATAISINPSKPPAPWLDGASDGRIGMIAPDLIARFMSAARPLTAIAAPSFGVSYAAESADAAASAPFGIRADGSMAENAAAAMLANAIAAGSSSATSAMIPSPSGNSPAGTFAGPNQIVPSPSSIGMAIRAADSMRAHDPLMDVANLSDSTKGAVHNAVLGWFTRSGAGGDAEEITALSVSPEVMGHGQAPPGLLSGSMTPFDADIAAHVLLMMSREHGPGDGPGPDQSSPMVPPQVRLNWELPLPPGTVMAVATEPKIVAAATNTDQNGSGVRETAANFGQSATLPIPLVQGMVDRLTASLSQTLTALTIRSVRTVITATVLDSHANSSEVATALVPENPPPLEAADAEQAGLTNPPTRGSDLLSWNPVDDQGSIEKAIDLFLNRLGGIESSDAANEKAEESSAWPAAWTVALVSLEVGRRWLGIGDQVVSFRNKSKSKTARSSRISGSLATLAGWPGSWSSRFP